jgi:hypothetical protein
MLVAAKIGLSLLIALLDVLRRMGATAKPVMAAAAVFRLLLLGNLRK